MVSSPSPHVCNQRTMTEQVRVLGADNSVKSAEEKKTNMIIMLNKVYRGKGLTTF